MDDETQAAEALVRWSHTASHRKPRGERTYPQTDEGDLAAWLDRLSAQIAEDRAEAARGRRRTTTWKPREAA